MNGLCQGCILLPCLFNLYAEYIMKHAGPHEAQAGIKISVRNINKLIYAEDTTVMAESKEELMILLTKFQQESEKDHDIWSHYFMANRWGNNGNSDILYFCGALKSLQMFTAAMKLQDASPWKKMYDHPR